MNVECPWNPNGLVQSNFCEELLCEWIVQPGNTWSNLGFLIIGILICHQSLKRQHTHMFVLGVISLSIGIGSGIYHATGTQLAGIADYAGMFLSTSFSAAINMRRWLRWSFRNVYIAFFALYGLWMFLFILYPQYSRLLYAASMLCCIIELRLYFRDGKLIRYKNLALAWTAFLIGFALWILDINKVYCNPQNHYFSGHAAWHLLMALSVFFTAAYYRQFAILTETKKCR